MRFFIYQWRQLSIMKNISIIYNRQVCIFLFFLFFLQTWSVFNQYDLLHSIWCLIGLIAHSTILLFFFVFFSLTFIWRNRRFLFLSLILHVSILWSRFCLLLSLDIFRWKIHSLVMFFIKFYGKSRNSMSPYLTGQREEYVTAIFCFPNIVLDRLSYELISMT